MKKRKRLVFIIAVNAVCLIGVLACCLASSAITKPLYAGYAARTWAGESGERFAQLSVYFPPLYDFSSESLYQLRSSLDTALKASSLESKDDRKLYTDAWSASHTISVAGERGTSAASVIGVGGDFFLFHPLMLRSGSYILPGDVMRDRVILDEELAWRLYGSVDLAGLEVVINQRPFIIAGVVARETDKASTEAYTGGVGMYMSYELLEAMTDNLSISTYEIVLPDIVTNFAENMLREAINSEEPHIINSTSRFTLPRLFDLIGSYGQRSMRPDSVAYPYWENAMRYAEDRAVLYLVISLILLICPAICAVIYTIRLILILIREAKYAARRQIKKRDDRAYKKYMENKEV